MRLIDADALLEQNAELADREIEHPKYQVTLREVVDEMPTIEERKTGKWIHDEPKDAIEAIFLARPKCSECGFEIAYETHFCPNCGADMRGGEDE